MVNFSLEGKVALVTGASYGIGFALATAFAQAGAKVVFNDIKQELVDKGIAAYKAEGIEAKGYVCDVTSEEQVNAMVAQIEKEVGVIDILVNNAGRGLFGPFDETNLEDELALLDVNIVALHMLTKLFLPDLKAKGRGHILNVASSAAFLPGPLLSSYYASKSYVLRLSEAVSEELRRSGSGVKISVLCPGPVRTEFDQRAGVTFSVPGLQSRAVAEYAVTRMFQGRLLIIPGAGMKTVHVLQRLVPDKLLARACWHVQRRKRG